MSGEGILEIFANFITQTKQSWVRAWNNKAFKKSLVTGIILIVIASISTDYFFRYIQHLQTGSVMNDWLLKELPSIDVSVLIVILMVSAILVFHIRCATHPDMFLVLTWALVFQLIFRIVTIDITKFYPPPGLVVLQDPIGSILYHSQFITRDLFYSGHTACAFLFFLCSRKKTDRYYMLLTTIVVAILLLLQHVHYTLDVISAPFFAFICYRLSQKVVAYQKAYSEIA